MFSTCPFVRPFFCYQTRERDILKKEPIDGRPRGKDRHETINFCGHKVKYQCHSHTAPK